MSHLGRTIHVRLSPGLKEKLEELHSSHFAGLPISTVCKLLLADQLLKAEEIQVEIVQRQIKSPSKDLLSEKSVERLIGLNPNKKRAQR